jgi:hypothetical protein
MNQLVTRNEFSNELATQDTASTAVAAQAKALVEARYIMAIRRPRDMDVVRERMLKECCRPSFAAVARYVKPIGNDKTKWPAGPSIRFAEAAVRNMGNVTIETMTVYDDREKRIVRVMVTDLEANVPYSQDITIAKTIERRRKKDGDTVISTRTNSYGDTVYILEATDDDIINKQQALISKAIRTQGLRLIPGDIIDECMDQVMVTQKNADAEDPDAAKRKLFDAFGTLGVRAEQLKEYLGHDAASLSPKELQDLRALYAAIRDGEATWRDVMEAKTGQAEAAKSASLDTVRAATAAKKGTPKAAAPAADEPTRTLADFIEDVDGATDASTASLVLDQARDVLPPDEFAQLTEAHRMAWTA